MESIKLPILPLRDPTLVLFPNVSGEVDVGREFSLEAIKAAQENKTHIIVAMQRDEKIDVPTGKDFYSICTIAEIKNLFTLEDGEKQRVIVIGRKRAILKKVERLKENPLYLTGSIQYPKEREFEITEDITSVFNNLYDIVSERLKTITLRKKVQFKDVKELSLYIDHIAYQLPIDGKVRLELLNEMDTEKRLRRILILVVELTKVKEFGINVDPRQSDDVDIANDELKRLYKLIQDSKMPEDAMKIANQEFRRLRSMPPSMSEFQVISNYVETLSTLPWGKKSEDNLDIDKAKKSLDEDHYGLEKPKERILEYLAVRKLSKEKKSDILCFYGPPGTGKAQPLDADVLTPNGFKKMGDIKLGEVLVMPNGETAPVIGVFPQGKKEIYKVNFSDNTNTECCKEHLWAVKNRQDRLMRRNNRVLSVEEISKNILIENDKRLNYSIPLVEKLDLNCNYERLLDPYLLGFLLGDGCQVKGSFSNGDDDIVVNITNEIEKLGCKVSKMSKYDYNISKLVHNPADNINKNENRPLLTIYLEKMGLNTCLAHQKFIPLEYKIAPFNIRLGVLQGLLDSDGHIGECRTIEYSSASKQLSMDVKFLVESLGGKATYSCGIATYTYKGEKKTGRDRHRIHICFPPNIDPFKCFRKTNIYKEFSKKVRFLPRYIKSIDYVGEKDAQCILVNHPDHLYITNNFIVTHNTSCGKSIAKAMGREFIRLSLGGVHDEAEIRGHRRTYVGAMVGKIMQQIKKVGVNNPVFMLDEVDKLSKDYRGDPGSALLEVLDPEQNNSFVDNYLNVPFDLSDVLFIATVNELSPIPPALRDRMDVIELNGYSPQDKLKIAQEHLVRKQKSINGLSDKDITISPNAISKIIEEYTSEAGVRSLERQCKTIFRKLAVMVSGEKEIPSVIKSSSLNRFLGPPRIFAEKMAEKPEVGLSCGLAWTKNGGTLLFVESVLTVGDGKVKLTGNLGEVIKESATAAYTWIKANAVKLGVDIEKMNTTDVHIHFPAGAIPKDGPSAGIAITTCILSSLLNKPVRNDIAMTGEITLRGRVLPIGGLIEKSMAADRSGIKKIICPEQNKYDVDEIPEDVRNNLEFTFVSELQQALDILILKNDEDCVNILNINKKDDLINMGFEG